jgi:raffinose/stachyose/melibiose transport system substrate-binding protein
MRKFLFTLFALFAFGTGLSAQGGKEPSAQGGTGLSAQGKVVLTMGDNHPDRTSGMGLVFQTLINDYKAANPNVDIQVESYPDDTWHQKVKIYVTAGKLPDINIFYSFAGDFKPVIDAGFVKELNRNTYEKFGFLPGALDSNVYNGKLYGVPKTTDAYVVYYNKKLFNDAGIAEVPATLDELKAMIPKFAAKGIIPMVTNGKDSWPLSGMYDLLVQRISGNWDIRKDAIAHRGKFTDPTFLQAAQLLRDMTTSWGLFPNDLMLLDYGAARNLFGQGRAAMYFMGTWEVGLASDMNFPEEFRSNVDAFKFPAINGGKGSVDDLMAWYGANIFVNNKGENVDASLKFLEYICARWPVTAWEKQAGFPAQKVTARASDTQLAQTLLKIIGDAKTTSGSPTLDSINSQFSTDMNNAIGALCARITTPEAFCAKLEAASVKATQK